MNKLDHLAERYRAEIIRISTFLAEESELRDIYKVCRNILDIHEDDEYRNERDY